MSTGQGPLACTGISNTARFPAPNGRGLCAPAFNEAAQDRRQVFGDVFGYEAWAEFTRRCRMQPDRGACRLESRHRLRQKAADHPPQHIAGAGGRKPRGRSMTDRRAALRVGDDGILPFQDQDRSHECCAGAGTL